MFIRQLLHVYLNPKFSNDGLSYRQLARKIGVSHTVLWRFVRGHSVKAEHYIKILRFLLMT